MFHNLLVAIDGSPHASTALTEAIDIARQGNATLTVITTVPDPATWLLGGAAYSGGIDFEAIARETEREYRDLLESAIEQVPQTCRSRRCSPVAGPPSGFSSRSNRTTTT
jgi:nucleotide-binding universal stress UspA family protein